MLTAAIHPRIAIVSVLIGGIALFHVATIRHGHRWGGDFSLYISHARNLVEGRPYADTGYCYNPFSPSLSPRMYPPVFPVLLSPIYAWFGLDLRAMKIEQVGFFVVFLVLFVSIFGPTLPFRYLALAVAILGFNPFFWDVKDDILSDLPFLIFVYASLVLVQQAFQRNESQERVQWPVILGAGVCLGLAYGTRKVGLALWLCLLCYSAFNLRKRGLLCLKISAIVCLYIGLQALLLQGDDTSYADQLIFKSQIVWRNINWYPRALSLFWDNGFSKIMRYALFMGISILAVTGYGFRLKTQGGLFELFVPCYLLPIMLWPSYQSTRFLIPIIPLYVYYACLGSAKNRFFQKNWRQTLLWWLVFVTIAGTYLSKYSTVDFDQIADGIEKHESRALFTYIRDHTEQNAVFIFAKPRVLALFTGRKAAVYFEPERDGIFWTFCHSIQATHLIAGRSDPPFWTAFVEKNAEALTLRYANADFRVYQIRAACCEKRPMKILLDKSHVQLKNSGRGYAAEKNHLYYRVFTDWRY